MKASNANKVISVLLSVAMCPMMVPSAAFAAEDDAASGASSPSEQTQPADQAEGVDAGASSSDTIAPQSEATGEAADASTGEAAAPGAGATINGYSTLEEAVQNATVDDQGVITYKVTGKVNVGSTGWVQVRPAAATNAKVVKFVGKSADAEICITQGVAILADQGSSALSVEFSNLKLSKLNPTYAGDYGQSTNYFTTWLRNTDAASNCVTYTNCEFPNGVCNNQYGKTVFNSCTFTNTVTKLYNMWVYGGNVEVKGGSFTGVRGVKVYTEGTATVAPKVDIAGASFAGVSEKAAIVVSKPATVTLSNISATDCAKGLIQKDIEGSSEEVTLNANGTGIGGNFDITANTGSDATKAEFNLNAGTLTSEVSSDFLADGFALSKSSDGTFGVAEAAPAAVAEVNGKTYPSLQEAINAASRKATVKLLADTTENVTISTPYVTLDLNGHTLNGGTEKGKPALTVTARVTVMDSSETQTGTIMREDTAENSGVSSHYVIDVQDSGWLFFQSGNVKNDSGAGGTKGASLVRVGDDSKSAMPGLTISGGTFTQDNFIVLKCDHGNLYVKGGEINSANSYAVQNWKNATIKDSAVINGNVSTWTYGGGGSDLQIQGGTVNGNVESVTYDGVEGKPAKVSITGGIVSGALKTVDYSTGSATDDPTKAAIEVTAGTFSTADPSSYLVEGSTVTKNDDGTYGVEKAYLAKVGGTSYYTMDEAFKAQTASGEAITLLRDYTTGSTFNSGSIARVVDLNDHTWTCTGTDANSAAFEINHPNASLTVKNGKVASSQLVGLIPSAMGGTITYDNSTLTFEGVEASTTATSGIETNGNNTNDTVVLKNSTLNVPNGFGIYFPSSGTLTIDNSTINAKTMGAQVCSGNLNVNSGSTITVSGDPVAKTENDGAIQDGAAISIVNRPGYKGLGQIAITGGTFKAKDANAAIKAYTWDSSTEQESAFDNTAKTVAVYGGIFSSSVPEALCAEGCKPIENPDGTHGVSGSVAQVGFKAFNTLQAAIDAAQDGETVTLLADATEDATISAGKNITLDLGGKTLTNTNTGKATLTIAKGATAAVKNGNVIGGTSFYTIQNNGTATLEDVTATAGNNDSSMIDNYGTLTITSGTYTGGLDTVKNEPNAKLNITGGTFTLTKGNSKGFTGVVFNYGELTISGGEFIQSDKSAPYAQAQVIYTDKSGSTVPSTVISGGTFKNLCTSKTAWTVRETNAANGATQVSGGTFNKSITEGYCADGFIPTKNADGTYGVKEGHYVAQIGSKKYETLADAIRLATKGKTIQLLTDATENITIAANKQITLDLNGYTLNGGTGTAKATILNEGTVTITDTSAGKTGTIKRDDRGIEGETSYYVIKNIGTMVIDQANVVNNSGYKKANSSGSMVGSSLICNGDDDPQASLTINGGTFNQPNFLVVKNGTNGTLTVNGGTLTSNHSAVQNWNKAQILGGSLTGQIWTDAWVEGAIGETIIGGDAQFTGEIVVDITGEVPPTLKIEGGSLNVTSWRVTSDAAAANATIAVSGGTFAAAVPENYCAEGYVPTANTDGTYGVKLAEGAYLLQDYRSGDQASWTYPTKDSMAFAGWYKDAAFTTACTASDVEGAAYAKFVPITDLLKFKGGSLRMDKGVPSESTYLRFGYTKAIPEKATYIENGWYYKRLSAPTSGDRRLVAYNNALNNDGTITSNLVFNGVAKNYYTANFTEKAFVKYMTVDGTTVEAVEDAYHSRSVSEVADAILAHPMASEAEKDYATSIKSAIQ